MTVDHAESSAMSRILAESSEPYSARSSALFEQVNTFPQMIMPNSRIFREFLRVTNVSQGQLGVTVPRTYVYGTPLLIRLFGMIHCVPSLACANAPRTPCRISRNTFGKNRQTFGKVALLADWGVAVPWSRP